MAAPDTHPPKPGLRWFQFNLRALLLFTFAVSALFSYFAYRSREGSIVRLQEIATRKGFQLVAELGEDEEVVGLSFSLDPVWSPRPVWTRGPGDSELALLEGFTALRRLNLSRSEVTDAGLVHLERLTSLQVLDLRDTQVSDEGVSELQVALPGCEIRR